MTRRRIRLFFLLSLATALPVMGQTFYSESASSGLGFGSSLALMGDELYVGSAPIGWPRGDEPAMPVYQYLRNDNGVWEETGRLMASDGTTGNNFGRSIYVDESMLVIGAPGVGAAYLFERNSENQWEEKQKLMPSKLEGDAHFAGANDYAAYRSKTIVKAGDRLAITSYSSVTSMGAVHVFKKDGDSWIEETILTPESETQESAFGWSIAAERNIIFVGAWRSSEEQGTVHRFQFDEIEGNWKEVSPLPVKALEERAAFGYSLTAQNGRLFVGAPGQNGNGSIFAYTWNTSLDQWTSAGELLPSTPGRGFGGSVDVSGETLIAGNRRGGNAMLFEYDRVSNQWTGQHILAPMDQQRSMGFGFGIATNADYAVVGSPRADFEEGIATVYERDNRSGAWMPVAMLESEVKHMTSVTGEKFECKEGNASLFDCEKVDLLSFMSIEDLSENRGVKMTDLWGWTDPDTGVEYVLQARTEGVSFVDIRDPYNPVYVGQLLKTASSPGSAWRDVKVYKDHAFIVSDGAAAHGMQVFDLTQLRDVDPAAMPITFEVTAHYDKLNSSHNIVINEETGFAYAIGNRAGGETCGGQLHMINIQDPKNPTFAGCFFHRTPGGASSGGAHDAQCVIYKGPDAKYVDKEICFNSSSSSFIIADVTDKESPLLVARTTYPNLAYTHQGWLTEDHKYFYMNDELDELNGNVENTRTLIWDVAELEDPVLVKEFMLSTKASDHNLYIRDNLLYQSNYQAGLRIIDITDPTNPVEVGHFDTTPNAGDEAGFGGSWSNYPYFKSGIIAVSSRGEGLFLLKKQDVDI